MAGKPGDETTPLSPESETADAADTAPGRLGMDDRGNMTWEWRDSGELQADDPVGTAERIRVLVDPRLDVLEDRGAADEPRAVNPKGLKAGYNPYNSGPLGKQTWKKKKNLQELSKWIELRKKMAQRSDDE